MTLPIQVVFFLVEIMTMRLEKGKREALITVRWTVMMPVCVSAVSGSSAERVSLCSIK